MRDRLNVLSKFVNRTTALGALGLSITLFISTHCVVGQETLAKVKEGLKSPDEKVRLQAIDVLRRQGPAAKDAVAELAALLEDASPRVKAYAALALQAIGPAASEATSRLIKMATDPDPHVRRVAVSALNVIHPDAAQAVPALSKELSDPDPAVRVAALNALTNYGEAASGALAEALDKPETRFWAALALGELGPQAKSAVPSLTRALGDEQAEVRREVAIALCVSREAAPAVPELIKALSDKDVSVRVAAAFALGHIGPPAAAAASELQKGMTAKDELLPTVSAWAIARIEPENKAAREKGIAMLTKALENKNPRVHIAALRGLVSLVEDPARLTPLLVKAMDVGDAEMTAEALAVAAPLGEASVPVLVEALNRHEGRGRAAVLVAKLGPKAGAAAKALGGALADEDPEVRREVLFALASIGEAAAPAQEAIVKLLDDPEPRIRATAAYALGRIGPKAAAAAPQLRKDLESPDAVVRVASAYALVHLLPNDSQVAATTLPVLMQGLKNENIAVRRGSAEALGTLGKAGRGAIAALQTASHDPDPSVAKAALVALERVGGAIISPQQRAIPLKR